MPIFRARYKGTCAKCHGVINQGETIQWSRKVRGAVYHIRCGTEIEAPDAPAIVSPEGIPDAPEGNGDASATLDALADALAKRIPPSVDEELVKQLVKDAVAEAEGRLDKSIRDQVPLKVVVQTPDAKVHPVKGQVHQTLPKLLYLIGKGHHTYLYGPPGCGKSHAARQCAETLDIPFGYISLNPQTPDSRLLGFLDANGNYRDTIFHRLYAGGGVFCIDELDNASPSLLTTLNSMLENGIGAFPNGMVDRHADFVVVATGNTVGKGANPQFPERRPFDAAFAERFSYLEWGYDTKLEMAITMGINHKAEPWVAWVRKVREWSKVNAPRLVVSPRVSFKGAEYLKDSKWTLEEIADAVLFKGLETDLRKSLLSNNTIPHVERG